MTSLWKYGHEAGRPRPMLLFFALLQIADIATTNHALALPGHAEINPVMASAMTHLGPAWWLPKIAIVALAVLTARLAARRRSKLLTLAFHASVAITFMVVMNNIARL
jgi:hypothetical protein